MKRRYSTWIVASALSALMICLGPSPAHAAPVLTFTQLTAGGILFYDGLGDPLFGSGIPIDIITSSGTPVNNFDALGCICTLNFSTGPLITLGNPTYTFSDAGSFFDITGSVYNGPNLVASGNLVTGQFVGDVFNTFLPSGADLLMLQNGNGTDTKNPDLLRFFGLTGGTFTFDNVSVGSTTDFESNGGFTGAVTFEQVHNTATTVPEPMSLSLLVTGLIVVGIGRKKLIAD